MSDATLSEDVRRRMVRALTDPDVEEKIENEVNERTKEYEERCRSMSKALVKVNDEYEKAKRNAKEKDEVLLKWIGEFVYFFVYFDRKKPGTAAIGDGPFPE